jgi:hypothetical protein
VFLEIPESAVADDVADQLARSLGVEEYEVQSAAPLAAPTGGAVANARRHLRRAVITQVRVEPDGRALSVQARHRPYESIERIDVEQSDDAVTIAALVGATEGDERDRYVSFAVAFSWVATVLDRPLGDREIIRDDPDRRPSRSEPIPPAHDEVLPKEPIETIPPIESEADTEGADWSAWRPHLI